MLHLSFVTVTSMNFSVTRINHVPCPPSLSASWKFKLGIDSDIVRCIEDVTEEQDDTTPIVDAVVLDGPAIVCVLKHAATGTFREYARDVFLPYVEHQLGKGHRIAVVWYNYTPASLKAQTRDTRGKLIRRRVEPNNAVPKKWGELLRNKIALFVFLSRYIGTMSTDKQVICPMDKDVIFRQPMDWEDVAPCSHEAADSGMIVNDVDDAANT